MEPSGQRQALHETRGDNQKYQVLSGTAAVASWWQGRRQLSEESCSQAEVWDGGSVDLGMERQSSD